MNIHSLILAMSLAAVRVIAQDVLLGPYEATFFYFGYLHEYETMTAQDRPQGIFIAGSQCRRAKCTFDQFLNHATGGNRGSYQGGIDIDGSSPRDAPWNVTQNLISRGMLSGLLTADDRNRGPAPPFLQGGAPRRAR